MFDITLFIMGSSSKLPSGYRHFNTVSWMRELILEIKAPFASLKNRGDKAMIKV